MENVKREEPASRSDMENEKEKNPTLLHESLSATEPSDMENKKNFFLPPELIFEILLRLPVRSLLRLKCVCRSWFFLISDPQFAASHFDLSAAPTHRLLLRCLDEDKVKSFDLDASLADCSAFVTLNLPPPPKCPYPNPLCFLGSCRGFMLSYYQVTGEVIVWNPITKFYKRIPYLSHELMFNYLYGFRYDSSSDDYFVVRIGRRYCPNAAKIQALSVKSANSWYDIQCRNDDGLDISKNRFILGDDYRHGVFLNNSLHWLVISQAKSLVVIAFDLLEKSLSEILLPPVLTAEYGPEFIHVRVLGRCLSLCYTGSRCGKTEIWVMKEYKVQSSWTKAFVLNFCDIPRTNFYPIHLIEGGGVFGSNGYGRLMKFNSMGKLLEHHEYMKENKNVQKYFHMYRESLLLFPR